MSGRRRAVCLALLLGLGASMAEASLVIPLQWVNGPDAGKAMGTVRADDTPYGLLLTPSLKGLASGTHGFHLHVLPLCDNGGQAAGGHYDPQHTNVHRGPYQGSGHLGDLPVLIVDAKGDATLPVLAPRLKLSMIKGHALIVHAGTDDYTPAAMKQSADDMIRLACGAVPWY